MDIPEYLPLTPAISDLIQALSDGPVTWATPQTITRARKFELVTGTGNGLGLTALGAVVVAVTREHVCNTSYAHPGRIGVKGRCRCGDWKWSTNEGGRDGQRRVRNAFTAHLAAEIAARLPAGA